MDLSVAAAAALRAAVRDEVPQDSLMLHLGYRMVSLQQFTKKFAENSGNEAFMLLFLYEYMRERICVVHQASTGRVYGPAEEKRRHGDTLEALAVVWKGDVKSRGRRVKGRKCGESERLTMLRVTLLYLIFC